jgi:cystathionine beta-lyase
MVYDFDAYVAASTDGLLKWKDKDEGVLGLGVADMDFKAARPVIRALSERAQKGIFSYSAKPDSYYRSIIGWYRRRYGWEVKREWLLNAPGIWPALRMCLGTYARPGDRVIVQSPRFFPIQHVVDDAGCHLVTNPMVLKDGRYELDFEDFERKVAECRPAVYFLVNLHNPTGRIFTRAELERLYAICAEYHVLVVSDEVHATIAYDGAKHTPAPSLNEAALHNTVLLNSASKGYNLMDLTYCFVVIPDPELRGKFARTMLGYDMNFATNTFGAIGTAAALGPECDDWQADVAAYLRANLEHVDGYLRERVPQIRVVRPEGSFVAWLDCRGLNLDDDALLTLFTKQARVDVRPGIGYGPEGSGFVRMGFASPRAVMNEALHRIEKAVATL